MEFLVGGIPFSLFSPSFPCSLFLDRPAADQPSTAARCDRRGEEEKEARGATTEDAHGVELPGPVSRRERVRPPIAPCGAPSLCCWLFALMLCATTELLNIAWCEIVSIWLARPLQPLSELSGRVANLKDRLVQFKTLLETTDTSTNVEFKECRRGWCFLFCLSVGRSVGRSVDRSFPHHLTVLKRRPSPLAFEQPCRGT